METGGTLAVRMALWILYGGASLALLGIWSALAWRAFRGIPGAEIEPDNAVSAGLIIALSCLCLPFPFFAWLPMWWCKVRRADGTTWSVRWKVAYMVAPILPIVIVVVVFKSLGYREPPFGASFLAPLATLLVWLVDIAVRRIRRAVASARPGTG